MERQTWLIALLISIKILGFLTIKYYICTLESADYAEKCTLEGADYI